MRNTPHISVDTQGRDRLINIFFYGLLDPPSEEETNDDYYEKLSSCFKSLGLPVPNKEEI